MTYAQGPYGQAPYGGFSFDPTGPSLVSSTPTDGGFSVAVNATISFILTSPSTFDPYSLSVRLDGVPAIIGSTFLAGYDGTIVFDGFVCTVTITAHPDFGYGTPVSILITVTDLAAISQTFSVVFHTVPGSVTISETLGITEAENSFVNHMMTFSENLGISESTGGGGADFVSLSETLSLVEQVSAESIFIENLDVSTIQILFFQEFRVDSITDIDRYRILPIDGGVPLSISAIEPVFSQLQSGITGSTGTPDTNSLFSHELELDGAFTSTHVGDYVVLTGPNRSWNRRIQVRIVAVVSATRVRVDKPILIGDPFNGSLTWIHTSAVQKVLLTVSKATNGKTYELHSGPFFLKVSGVSSPHGDFVAAVPRPRLASSTFLPEGYVLVVFGEAMRSDAALTNVAEYTITGPSMVEIVDVVPINATSVLLKTMGLGDGSYTLTVNASGTPKDIAGNPIDPTFNTGIFTAGVPLAPRSIFTDHGPIAKPPLILATGSGAVLNTFNTITLPGATILPSHVGLYVKLTTTKNGGVYQITARLSMTQVRLIASFTLPDPQSGSIAWQLFDPRNGQIADDPSDVAITINGTPIIPDAVIGLLGQVVLPSTPVHGDDVQIGYSWVSNPTVDFRRLNSKEFRLNNWNRDIGYSPGTSNGHAYRYNNTFVRPTDFVPEDIQAILDQPIQRNLKYRAYERAYTAVLNDPTLLLLNSPTHSIAFPPLQKTISQTFVSYDPVTLPENDTNPWIRYGTGTASVVSDQLVVGDVLGGVFPTGQPIFWSRTIDLTFPHVFAATWQMGVHASPITEGVFTGIAAGYSDTDRAYVVGFLIDAGTPKIGFLVNGLDPSILASWAGGLDGQGNPTGEPTALDWTLQRSFRIFRGKDQIIRLYVDGAVTEILRLQSSDFPYLSDLHDPFNSIEGVFFGSLSLAATNTSIWDFVRYLILPTNPIQTSPAVYVSYEATTNPEAAIIPWTPVGFHGTETILGGDFLLLDSTSATTPSVATLSGLIDGDFRGFVRMEPLLSAAADVTLDLNVQVRTFTHGITPNALMAAIDDGDRLVQLAFLSDTQAPKLSYGGRTFPDQVEPVPWTLMGTASAAMVGQILRITDAATNNGRVYFTEDTAPTGDPTRVVDVSTDFILEARFLVHTYAPDGGGYAGAMAQVYDGARSVGFMIRDVGGVRYITLHADGVPITQFAFEWMDGEPHTYRLVKSFSGDLVSLFVDGVFVGSEAYSSFPTQPGPPQTEGIISFGSSTPASMQSTSTVDWYYANAWRVLANFRRFVGLWKGFDDNELTGYHLPVKATGRNVSVVGNTLTDPVANFISVGVVAGDQLVVDVGPNKGTYSILSVPNSTTLTVSAVFTVQPSTLDYRVVKETNWSSAHKYRIMRNPEGSIVVFEDMTEIMIIGYNAQDLPSSMVGVPRILAGGLPAIVFGAFDPTNLSQSSWDFVRYGITRSPTEMRIVPHHQVLNQRNVVASPEHLNTNLPHTHTDFWSSSTGIPPAIDPDFLANPGLLAFSLLNEDTPLVPLTQTAEVRHLMSILEPVSGLNTPEDVLNAEGTFTLNDGAVRYKFVVPDDVLYNSLQVIETSTGSPDLLAPADDDVVDLGTLFWQDEVCLQYTGNLLPEQDTSATPWVLVSDNANHVTRSAFAGVLTYGTDGTGTRSVYRNATPLLETTLETEVKFRFKVASDSTGGTGDSQIRVGLSAGGVTMALAFVTSGLGERYVLVYDMAANRVVGGTPFDFLDGSYHVYRVVLSPSLGTLQVYIDG